MATSEAKEYMLSSFVFGRVGATFIRSKPKETTAIVKSGSTLSRGYFFLRWTEILIYDGSDLPCRQLEQVQQ